MANKLSLYYPAKPFITTQAWGIYNPAYLQFGFSKHNGIDFMLDDDKKLLCPIDNFEVYDTGYGEDTGYRVKGNTKDFYDFPDGKKARVNMIFMHLEKPLCRIGEILNVGDAVGIADNTGFSTGPHTHFMCRRVDGKSNLIDKNDADNTINPALYWNGYYAEAGPLFILLNKLKQQLAVLLGR